MITESSTSVQLQRPNPFSAWVAPATELGALHRYVAHVAIPVLVTGLHLPRSVPPEFDLGDTGHNDRQRLLEGGWQNADTRLQTLLADRLAQAMTREPTIPEMLDEAP